MKSHLTPADIEKLTDVVARNRDAYEEVRSPRSGRRTWDYIALTAANRRQARGYEAQVKRRRESGWIPASTTVMVIPDPGDQRVGSGAATLNVIRVVGAHLQSQLKARGFAPTSLDALFSNRRILILHSGGDSKRIPHYSTYGKAFGAVPILLPNGATSTIFDEMLIALATFPERMEEGIVVASGDVLLAFDPEDVNLRWPGVTGIAFRSPWSIAAKHGVYVQSADRTHVQAFLQKPSRREMGEAGAVDGHGNVCLDSGLLRFDLDTTCLLARLEGLNIAGGELERKRGLTAAARRAGIQIDLYDEILRALAPATDESAYLDDASSASQSIRRKIWDALRSAPFRVAPLSPAYLLHIGATKQFRQLLTQSGEAQRIYGFARRLNATVHGVRLPASACVYDSVLATEKGSRVGARTVIEACDLKGPVRVGAGAILHGISDEGRGLRIAANVVAHSVPLRLPDAIRRERKGRSRAVSPKASRTRRTKRVSLLCLYGVGDDPKLSVEQGATLFGADFLEWLDRREIDPEVVWPHVAESERSLWNARLYPVLNGDDAEVVLWLQDDRPPSRAMLRRWEQSQRLSFAEALEYVDCEEMCRRREEIRLRRLMMGLEDILPKDVDVGLLWNELDSAESFRAATRFVRSWLDRRSDPLLRMRGFKLLADMFDGERLRSCLRANASTANSAVRAPGERRAPRSPLPFPPSDCADVWRLAVRPQLDEFVCDALAAFFNKQAFEEVKRAVAAGLSGTSPSGRRSDGPTQPAERRPSKAQIGRLELAPGLGVVVSSPARVDFGGGWSDTPPHSLRRGGAVLNAAVRLDGRQPIRALVRVLADPVLRLVSKDAGVEIVLHDWREALDHDNPSDAVALHKAALCCAAMAIRRKRSRSSGPETRNPKSEVPLSGLGLEIVTETNVPQGSGLGTSSILGGVVLRALFELFRFRVTDRDLFSYVSNLEQMMSTGGGWQDQIGGLTPGVKLITTNPGVTQTPFVAPLELSAAAGGELAGRMLLFYVGERRIAKDILQAIMGKYISGDGTTLRILMDIQRIAREMKAALEDGEMDRFGALMWEHWELNKKLDPQSTTPHIEEIVEEIRPLVSGLKMVGAGGGGFMEIVCRRRCRRALEALLSDLSETDESTVYALEVDEAGPRVEVVGCGESPSA